MPVSIDSLVLVCCMLCGNAFSLLFWRAAPLSSLPPPHFWSCAAVSLPFGWCCFHPFPLWVVRPKEGGDGTTTLNNEVGKQHHSIGRGRKMEREESTTHPPMPNPNRNPTQHQTFVPTRTTPQPHSTTPQHSSAQHTQHHTTHHAPRSVFVLSFRTNILHDMTLVFQN